MKMHEKFYYKVQCDALELGLKHVLTKPLVSLWSPGFFYVTCNHIVFYIVPEDDFFLTESFYRQPSNVGIGNVSSLSEAYYFPDTMQLVTETGRLRTMPMGDLYREFDALGTIKYVNWGLMKCFPKQIKFAASDPKGPFFIYSPLNHLLGGVWPTTLDPELEPPEPLPELDIIGETKEEQ